MPLARLDPLRGGAGAQHASTSSTTARQSTGLGPELHLARLDLGEIEDVVDQLQQVLAAVEDVAQELARAAGDVGSTFRRASAR